MSIHENDLVERLQALAAGFEMAPASLADDVARGRRRARRNRGLVAGAVAATVAVAVGVTAAVGGQDRAADTEPVDQPGLVAGAVPVWYDANGLHRGDVVEQTPVEITIRSGDGVKGALALVRTGAVYVDLPEGDVWFHPWGGEPRIVGHDSDAGPGGDPTGDIAAWFEGSDPLNGTAGELVIYDTAAAREVSRTMQAHGVADWAGGDHYPTGNGFLEVSAERVVWTTGSDIYSHDVQTGETTKVGTEDGLLIDVAGEIEAMRLSLGQDPVFELRAPGLGEQRFPDLETHLRLSPSGSYVLAVEGTDDRHAAAIVDTTTGEVWQVPHNRYPWIAWSYADIALVDIENRLLACDATRSECEVLPAERPFLLPTN